MDDEMNDECGVETCKRSINARGLCSAHWQRLRKQGTLSSHIPIKVRSLGPARIAADAERFFQTVRFIDRWYDDGLVRTRCLEWTKPPSLYGYGQFNAALLASGTGRKNYRAHRWLYEYCFGPIPSVDDEGQPLVLGHLCHDADLSCNDGPKCPHRLCVNPTHLRLMTQKENVVGGRSGPRKKCPQGHALVGSNLYVNPNSGDRHCRECNRLKNIDYRKRKKDSKDG